MKTLYRCDACQKEFTYDEKDCSSRPVKISFSMFFDRWYHLEEKWCRSCASSIRTNNIKFVDLRKKTRMERINTCLHQLKNKILDKHQGE